MALAVYKIYDKVDNNVLNTSVIIQETTLTRDEIPVIDDEVNIIRVFSDNNYQLNDTMNNILQRDTEKVCQSDHPNLYPDVCEMKGSDISNNVQHQNANLEDEDPEFFPMIATRGKQPGSVKYIWEGYVYSKDGYTRSFRCSKRNLYQCPGRAVIKDGEVIETKPHSHPREPEIQQVEQLKENMITRAQNEKSISLRTIYSEACKTQPLVKKHLGLDMMLSIMKRARCRASFSTTEPYDNSKKNIKLDFKWAKDWLEIPPGQDKVAFCNVCGKKIGLPSRICVYNHYLSKMHEQAELQLCRRPKKRFHLKEQNGSTDDPKCTENTEPPDPDSDQEDTYVIEVLDQFQEEVQHMEAKMNFKKGMNKNDSSFVKEVTQLQTSPGYQVSEENDDLRISSNRQPRLNSTISLHVWDSNTGQPTSGLEISLYREKEDGWSSVWKIRTDQRGKCSDLMIGEDLTTGIYKLNLDTRSYYAKQNQRCFYPCIEIVFEVEKVDEPYHFPVQLSPFAYNVSRLSIS